MLWRLFSDQPITENSNHYLDGATHHHLAHVIRAKTGDSIILFDGSGKEYPATIMDMNKKNSVLAVSQSQAGRPESALSIHLGIAISTGKRLELALQKSVELGVTQITPLLSQKGAKCHHPEHKHQHWKNIIINACEQCGRSQLPILHAISPLNEWTSTVDATKKYLCSLTKHNKTLPSNEQPNTVALLIGPASGLTDEEVIQAQQHQFQTITLGPRILRTETACISAITLMQWLWGDLKHA